MWLLQRRDEVGARMSSGALSASPEKLRVKSGIDCTPVEVHRGKMGFVKNREMISRRAHAS